MVMHPCPHCGKLSISGLRRAFLGPAWPTRCDQCGGAVGVPWWSTVLVVPISAALILAHQVTCSTSIAAVVGVLASTLVFVVWGSFVPLVKR